MAAAAPPSDAGRLVLASLNLDSLDDEPERPLRTRLPVLRPLLEQTEADILCLQEVNGQKRRGRFRDLAALDGLLAGTRYEGYSRAFTQSPSGHGPLDAHNLVILSRRPMRESGQIHHGLVPAPAYRRTTGEPVPPRAEPVRWERPLLYAAVEVDAQQILWVVNLHLRAPIAAFVPGEKQPDIGWRRVPGWAEGFFLASVKRIGQALEARLFIDRLLDGDPQALIVVCGDFNADGSEMPVRLIAAAAEDTENPALAGREMVLLGEADDAAPAPHTVIHAGRLLRPDHMLASPALAARHVATRVLNEALPDDTAPPAARSVHAAIIASFAFSGPPKSP
jgi:endonuclease/exonuclease/phosphatase family metal-dependent hydrolase